jgi:hypothetical protein
MTDIGKRTNRVPVSGQQREVASFYTAQKVVYGLATPVLVHIIALEMDKVRQYI